MNVWVRSTALVLVACLAGCAAVRLPAPPVEDITPLRKARRGRILDDLQRRRDRIEYQAAVSRCEQGDRAGCESMLRSILDRNGTHRDARLTEKAGYPDQAGHTENAGRRGGLSDTTSFGG